MQEVWKDIPSFEGKYQVSNLGNVRSLNYNNEKKIQNLKICSIRNGYSAVNLYFNGRKSRKMYKVHRLVLCTFQNKPLNYPLQVNHIDGVKNNNLLENLEFVTPSDNAIHAFNVKLRKPLKGQDNPKSKLTETQVIEIKYLLKQGNMTQKDIALIYGVNRITINNIHTGVRWKHITI